MKINVTLCPNCGSNQVRVNENTGKIECLYCSTQFVREVKVCEDEISKLQGEIISTGASELDIPENLLYEYSCVNCGANLIIDAFSFAQRNCPWCRSQINLSNVKGSATVPDKILPFKVGRPEALEKMKTFISNRIKYTHPEFKDNFNLNNIQMMYLPYFLIDCNVNVKLNGYGEHLTHSRRGKNITTYTFDLYKIDREYNTVITDITVDSNIKNAKRRKANNNSVIRDMKPFDTENCIAFDARYLSGIVCQNRDLNIETLKPGLEKEIRNLARNSCNETLTHFDRGIHWRNQEYNVLSERWDTALLPIWVYSYYSFKKDKNYYIAVNGRTGKLEGELPLNKLKLFMLSLKILLIYSLLLTVFKLSTSIFEVSWLSTLSPILFMVFLIAECIPFIISYGFRTSYKDGERISKAPKVDMILQEDLLLKKGITKTNKKIIGENHEHGFNVKGEKVNYKAIDKLYNKVIER